MTDSIYVPLNLPRWLEERPERFSGIEVVGRGFDSPVCIIFNFWRSLPTLISDRFLISVPFQLLYGSLPIPFFRLTRILDL
ncbi:hypothetical protein [Pseudanabaena sp. PCC 6802]|uniref:hypothetical protein n=1 Tax=Pseudanabaena sp. PCC 6802 TaxID=118173 RepID=UPI0003483422|nr:hypothetical protein [Pseudanabaena sp. PCC 6802]